VIKVLPQESSQGVQEEEPMRDWQTLSHVKWICKYHIIFVTKYRHQTIYGKLRRKIGGIIRDLCRQKGLDLLEGHAMKDHVHLCLSIPPKFSVSNTVGFLKGKSAIRIHRELLRTKKMNGLSFWAKGYCASTVGLDEEVIKKYIREQNNKH
jgi:REP-associated tyrosine transposase